MYFTYSLDLVSVQNIVKNQVHHRINFCMFRARPTVNLFCVMSNALIVREAQILSAGSVCLALFGVLGEEFSYHSWSYSHTCPLFLRIMNPKK